MACPAVLQPKDPVLCVALQVFDGNVAVSINGPTSAALRTQGVQYDTESEVGVVYDAVMEQHLREGHPEHPNRVKELNTRLQQGGQLARCRKLTAKLASDPELLRCHTQAHISKVEQLHSKGINQDGQPAEQIGDTYIISGDIYCNKYTSKAARSAAGCSIQAVQAVLSGQVQSAFAIVRPPGHHAECNELMGFCFFNNVAVAAHAALQQSGVERVLIFDWDVHHGNGTQQIFEADDRVLFISLHRRDGTFYPIGCGFAREVGKDRGTGYTVNVPWASKGMGDADYLAALELILDPIISQFDPQIVLVSAGFDAAEGDFLGKCLVSPAGFAAMTQRLQRYAGGKMVLVLEGGYVPSIVGECSCAVMQVLLGDYPLALNPLTAYTLHKTTRATLAKVDEVQRQHWPALADRGPFAERFQLYAASLQLQALSISRSGSLQVQPGEVSEATTGQTKRSARIANKAAAAALTASTVLSATRRPLCTAARSNAAGIAAHEQQQQQHLASNAPALGSRRTAGSRGKAGRDCVGTGAALLQGSHHTNAARSGSSNRERVMPVRGSSSTQASRLQPAFGVAAFAAVVPAAASEVTQQHPPVSSDSIVGTAELEQPVRLNSMIKLKLPEEHGTANCAQDSTKAAAATKLLPPTSAQVYMSAATQTAGFAVQARYLQQQQQVQLHAASDVAAAAAPVHKGIAVTGSCVAQAARYADSVHAGPAAAHEAAAASIASTAAASIPPAALEVAAAENLAALLGGMSMSERELLAPATAGAAAAASSPHMPEHAAVLENAAALKDNATAAHCVVQCSRHDGQHKQLEASQVDQLHPVLQQVHGWQHIGIEQERQQQVQQQTPHGQLEQQTQHSMPALQLRPPQQKLAGSARRHAGTHQPHVFGHDVPPPPAQGAVGAIKQMVLEAAGCALPGDMEQQC